MEAYGDDDVKKLATDVMGVYVFINLYMNDCLYIYIYDLILHMV